MIKVRVDTAAVERMIVQLRDGLSPEKLDPIVERVSFQTLASLIQATPKRWFGQLRSGWQIIKTEEGTRTIDIPSNKVSTSGTSIRDIALFVDQGTANDGAGYIYPNKAKRLYVPLTRRAAGGYTSGLKWGVDYVLAYRVRGIKGRHFIQPEREKAFARLRGALRDHIVKIATRPRK